MQRWAAKYSRWSRWQALPFSCSTSSSPFFLPCSLCQILSPKASSFFIFSRHAVCHWLPTKWSKAPRQNFATNLQARVSAAGIGAPWGGQPGGSQPLGLGGCHLVSLSAPIYLLAKIHQLWLLSCAPRRYMLLFQLAWKAQCLAQTIWFGLYFVCSMWPVVFILFIWVTFRDCSSE